MALKLFRAAWFLSALVVLLNLLYVYASLPETVVVQENAERISLTREWVFYIMLGSIVLINVLVYVLKVFQEEGANLRAWFHGLIITINIFFIIAMQALNVYNSSEIFNHNLVTIYLSASLGLILLWAVLWPLYQLYQKFFLKQAV
ncbi:MAG TPA: hypothetical protein VIQ51_04525 [Chryseosolibacter sp.]